jgi:hypothetical protein
MFVLHADCNNNWRKCQVCSESPPNDSLASSSQQCQSLEQSEPSNSSPTAENPTLDGNIDQTTTTAVNPGCYVEIPSDLPEQKKPRLMEENAFHQQEDHITEGGEAAAAAAAIANNNNDIRSTTSSVIIQDEVGISIAEPKCDNFPIAIDSVNTDEKMELHLKEEKDPIMGADLVVVDFDVSLVHNQSRVEALLLSRTFIGGSSAYRSSSSFTSSNDGICPYDDTVINVEYQGDNIIGYFDSYGNHAFKSSGGQRRLFGPVYSVRKYKPSADTEIVYAVIIWIDAAVKDKAEIEITSFDDYFELLKLS